MIMSKRMKNVHLIRTNGPSRLGRFVDTGNLFLRVPNDLPRGENVHVYITVDDTIKIGDREIIDNQSRLLKFTKETRIGKKVILSDDPKLVKDGVQEISEDFLEFLVQNPSCEFVAVLCRRIYKIILPQEEPKQEFTTVNGSSGCTITVTNEIGKPIPYCGGLEEPKQDVTMKETIEEEAEKVYPRHKGLTTVTRTAWVKGAKSDAARDFWFEKFQEQDNNKYSEEEVKLLIDFVKDCATNWDCDNDSHKYNTPCRMCEAEKVLKQFKNKQQWNKN